MKKGTFIIAIAGVLFSGCAKNFQSINTNPEALTSANMNYNYLFTEAQLITSGNSDANGYEDERNSIGYAACMIQHLSSTNSAYPGDKYLYNASDNSAYWEQDYKVPVNNIQEVIYHIKGDSTQTNFYNIARIFRVFIFQRMTDMYGDCPYSQAGLGYIEGITSPKYDSQQSIYMDMLNELKEAAANLDPNAANTIGAADELYGGDITEWQKFAYSEMLRLAMRIVKVDPTDAQTWAQAAIAGGVMSQLSDNAAFSHNNYTENNPTPNGNAWVLTGEDPNLSRVSQTFINYLDATNDPRLSWVASVTSDPSNSDSIGNSDPSVQLGQPNGYDNNGGAYDISTAPGYPGSQNGYSIVNRATFARLDAPTYFLTYAETALLEAEAAYRGWISGDPATFYQAGVTAAMQQMGQMVSLEGTAQIPTPNPIDDGTIATYLAANPYNASDALNQINTQYWVATFMDEYEAWFNWKRSGYPALTPVANYPGNATGGTIPRRWTYSTTEVSTNNANYKAAVANLPGGDKMTSRTWWDSK